MIRRLLAKILFGVVLLAWGFLNVPLWAGDYPFTEDWINTRDKENSFGPVPDSLTEGNPPPVIGPKDRIGWSSDGTNDPDDWAATAMGWSILAKAGLHDQFVHFDYNNRLNDKALPKERQNRKSSLSGALVFGFNNTRVFDGLDPVQLEAAIEHVKEHVNKSGPDSRFFYIQAGTFEVAYRALKGANPDKRKYCILLSHSGTNEKDNKWPIDVEDPTHVDDPKKPRSRGMVDCVNPINPPVGKPSGLGAGYYFTSKQGVSSGRPQFGNKSYREGWDIVDWMSTSPYEQYQWVYSRFKAAMDAKKCRGLDASDGGIVFALVTGEFDHGSKGGFVKLNEFLDHSLDLPDTPAPTVANLVLFDLDTNKVITEITNGAVIDATSLPSKVSIRANTDPVTIDCVTFEDTDAGKLLIKDEIGSLYTIAEDEDGRIQAWSYKDKTYNLKVVPMLNGVAGDSYVVSFHVKALGRR